jgi:hypothetical protein
MSFGTERRLSRPVRRVALALFVIAWLLVAVAGLAELFLVGYAEGRAADSLRRNGKSVSVKIEARPAVKLLFGRADEVVVRAAELGPSAKAEQGGNGLGDLIARTKAAERIDARVGSLVTRRVTLRDAHLVKRGDRLSAEATVTRKAIEAALPGNFRVSTSGAPNAFQIKGTTSVLGHKVSVRATISVSRGRLVIAPEVGGVAVLTLALLDDPRVSVDHVSATAVPGGYRFTADGHVT